MFSSSSIVDGQSQAPPQIFITPLHHVHTTYNQSRPDSSSSISAVDVSSPTPSDDNPNQDPCNKDPRLRLHLLPCSLQCTSGSLGGGAASGEDGREGRCPMANVDCFFDPLIREDNEFSKGIGGERKSGEEGVKSVNESKVCTFRGRMLRGVSMNLPEGYSGLVLHESDRPAHWRGGVADVESREFEVKGHFDGLHYWNLQSRPTADDKFLQTMTNWTKMATQIHKPVAVEQDMT